MIIFESLQEAVGILTSSWSPWLVIIPGLFIALVGAALPGISPSLVMALLLPFTLYMDFVTAMMFLTAAFTGGAFGGAVPAILINVPGTPSAVATAFDGYPMAQKGQHNEALGLGLCASAVGMVMSYVLLVLFLAPMATLVLRLGPLEMLVVVFWGLTLIATLRGKSIARGLIAGMVGLLIGTIGIGIRGDIRGTMGFDLLIDGIPPIPAMLGLFAASELFNVARKGYIVQDENIRRPDMRKIISGMRDTFRHPSVLWRGSLIGVLIGIIPGVGSSVANLVSYSDARRRSPTPEEFGTGSPSGVVAAEAADSSSEGGSMATLLALGLPGGGGTAVLLGAFAMHNITGGPRFLAEQSGIVYAILLGNIVQGIALVAVGLVFIYFASSIVRVPMRLLVPGVIALAVFGTFAITGTILGPAVLLCFGLLGWLMARHDYPVAAMVIGILLASGTEGNLLRTYQLSGGDVSFILQRPIALTIFALLIVSLLLPLWRRHRSRGTAMPG